MWSRAEIRVYGINTGFGSFADVHIPADRLRELQLNLVRSHAAGVGEPLAEAETRALMLLRANVLAKGFSGIRPETLERLLEMLNRRVHPVIPSQGSVGASGDLAPLAHLALALVGEGLAVHDGRLQPSAAALQAAGLGPVTLEAKEGLALINGTQLMTAVAALALIDAERLVRTADVLGALTLDALQGTDVAFDPRIHAARPHPGQAASARNLLRLLKGSAHARVAPRLRQGAGCLQPPLHPAGARGGARRSRLRGRDGRRGDERGHGQPHGLRGGRRARSPAGTSTASRWRSLRTCSPSRWPSSAAISERRIERLVNPALSDLPAFLAREGGVQSGLMLAHVTAAALASENKSLAHPASVDSIPTSANKEDHVSMGAFAARKAARVVANTARILAVEALAAAQALEFRRPLTTSAPLEAAYRGLRERIPPYEHDRFAGAGHRAGGRARGARAGWPTPRPRFAVGWSDANAP